jgi:hypothetical protein
MIQFYYGWRCRDCPAKALYKEHWKAVKGAAAHRMNFHHSVGMINTDGDA